MIVLLSPTPFDGVVHLPIIDQQFFQPAIDLAGFDAIIFTSKQAVKAINLITNEWKNLKIFSVGSGTTASIEALGGKVFYEATSFYGDTLADEIRSNFPEFKFFYPRAKEVVSNLESILEHSQLTSVVLYETICKEIDTSLISKNCVIIFTAPSTVKCFFDQHTWQESWQAVAIGKRTQEALDQFVSSVLSDEPTIKSAVAKAKELETH